MVRRFIGRQLFDVLPDGTSVPIVSEVPPRKLPIMVLSHVLDVQTAIEDFLSALILPVVQLPGITLPHELPIPVAIPEEPAPEQPPSPVSEPIGGTPEPGFIPVPTQTGNPIFTRFGVPPDELIEAIQEFWPQDQWKNAAEVSHGESSWRNDAINDTVSKIGPCGTRYFISSLGIWATTELSVGYFQINICAHGGSVPFWTNARNNARKGAELYRGAGNRYSAWAVTAGRLGLPT